jgi:hypothetical protein
MPEEDSHLPTGTEDTPLAQVRSSPRQLKPLDFGLRKGEHEHEHLEDLPDPDRERLVEEATRASHHDSDTDSDATDSEDFDWEAEDDARSTRNPDGDLTANVRRGRAVWRAFMRLSRFIRTLIIAVLGAGILITPLLVFQLRLRNTPGRIQAHVWSLWMAITWAASCGTYLVVDLAPTLALAVFRLFSHRVERMQITVEVRIPSTHK